MFLSKTFNGSLSGNLSRQLSNKGKNHIALSHCQKEEKFQLSSYFTDSQNRPNAEQFVWEIFKNHFQADIQDFYPQLLAIQSESGQFNKPNFKAVAGIRRAAEQPLFSEFYLQNSIQSELEKVFATNIYGNSSICRNNIVEVGNLAPAGSGQIRWLIVALTAYLYSAGFNYVVFTTIPSISNSFKRMGLPLRQLAEASVQQLPRKTQQQWGENYYRLQPKVYAGDIKLGFNAIAKKINSANPILLQLWNEALHLGEQQSRMAAVA